jgi:hypothetical protein
MKGSILDLLIIVLFIFVFAVVSIFALHFLSGAQESLNAVLDTRGQAEISTGISIIQNFDYAIVFLFFGSFIATIIGAYIVDTHPVFFIITLLLLVFIIVIVAQVGNFYAEFVETAALSSAAASFPLTTYIFQNIPLISVIFGFIIILVLYAKIKGGGIESGY